MDFLKYNSDITLPGYEGHAAFSLTLFANRADGVIKTAIRTEEQSKTYQASKV